MAVGNFPSGETPQNICDQNTTTKYLNFGACIAANQSDICGLNTGFYVTLQRGPSIVKGFQICAANDEPGRDPVRITLEGSNDRNVNLTFGTSWSLIHNGSTSLDTISSRFGCSLIQCISNSIRYESYRFLVTHKYEKSNSVQYSEVQLFGY